MWGILSMRYGRKLDALTEERRLAIAPALQLIIASALDRRRAKKNLLAEQESAGPFSVRWAKSSTSGSWFLPDELMDLDRMFGVGGSRTYRTPAPDAIRFVAREDPVVPGYIELPWPGGADV